ARAWSTGCRRSRSSSKARAPAARRRSARCRPPASRSWASRTSPRRRTTASARRSGGASSGPRPLPEVQAVPPRGHEALPQGRALPDREVRDRAPQLPAGRARPGPHQAVRVPAAAPREAEGAPLLRPAREAVPHVLLEGREGLGDHGRGAAPDARDEARQRRLPPRLRRLARAGTPARAPRPLPGQRPPREHPELPGAAGRHHHASAGQPGRAGRARRDRSHRLGHAVAAGRPRRPDRQGAQVAGARGDRHASPGIAHRRAVLEVERIELAVRTTLMDFQIPRIVHEEVDDKRGVFVIEPLDRGFGYTFGNSLRRVLLSSLEGAAVTSVKIEGVAHEFTTLPGVREDVTDILLNFKNLICRLHGDSPEIEVRLTKKGPGTIQASDI